MNKLARYLQIGGIGFIIVSVIRWLFIYYDVSQAILGIMIGIIFIGFGDIYNARKIHEERMSKLDQRLDAVSKFFMKGEFK